MVGTIFTLLLIVLLIGVFSQWQVVGVLKNEYTEIWHSIGRPNLFNNSISTSYKLHKFVWKKQYSELEHPIIIKYWNVLRWFQMFYLVLLPFIFGLFVIGLSK